jgi:dinuclear metal center YbgI/SA1388 family protein
LRRTGPSRIRCAVPAERVVTVAEVCAALAGRFPPRYAESWDAVGLVCGEPESPVRRVLFAVDPTEAVVDECQTWGADLLVTHHPLFFRAVHSVSADRPNGRIVARLIRAGIALYVAHTNADVAPGGVSDALAVALGLPADGLAPIRPGGEPADKVDTFVPVGDVERVVDALAAAGAGGLGAYRRCAFLAPGTGTFEPGPDAHPTIGRPGERETVAETRVEMIAARAARADVLAALRAAHPYEEPAYEIYEIARPAGNPRVGLGRIGELGQACPLEAFAARVAAGLPSTAVGTRFAGDARRPVRRVAVCGGSGGELAGEAAAAGADVLVTADLRHHDALDALAGTGLALIDPGHWASEWPWLATAAGGLAATLPGGTNVDTAVSRVVTDAWSAVVYGNEG